jgi:hypothetical protein
MYMAMPFNKNVMSNKMMMPAAALVIKAACGLETQLNTWMGNVVN